MIVSKADIKTQAFSLNFDVNSIKDNVIQLVEWEQVLTLFGVTMYDDIVADPSSYTTLIDTYLKPYIAYNVKAYISKANHIKTGNKGAQTAQGSNEQIADVEEAKREAMSIATGWRRQMITFLELTKPTLWVGEPNTDGIINKIIIL